MNNDSWDWEDDLEDLDYDWNFEWDDYTDDFDYNWDSDFNFDNVIEEMTDMTSDEAWLDDFHAYEWDTQYDWNSD